MSDTNGGNDPRQEAFVRGIFKQYGERSESARGGEDVDVRAGLVPVPTPDPLEEAAKKVGNLLDMWDGMANDTKELIRETETGFFNAVEAFRPRER